MDKKAFDQVNWDFLMYILGSYGFGERWCNWKKHYITTARFLVLVNGIPVVVFNSSCGLKEDDPLSPVLFVLVMNMLSRMLEVAVDGCLLSYFLVGGSSLRSVIVSHLLFADDTLIRFHLDPNQIRSLSALLLCFEAVLDLKVNQSKMVLVGLVNNIGELVEILRCKALSLPMKYIGLPLGAPHKSMQYSMMLLIS